MVCTTFGEDHSQVRDRRADYNFSILRALALKVLRDSPPKISLRRKRKRAALDPNSRLKPVSAVHA